MKNNLDINGYSDIYSGSYDDQNNATNEIDIESFVNKLDMGMSLEEISQEENIPMTSLYNCLEYLREQNIQVNSNAYIYNPNSSNMTNYFENNLYDSTGESEDSDNENFY